MKCKEIPTFVLSDKVSSSPGSTDGFCCHYFPLLSYSHQFEKEKIQLNTEPNLSVSARCNDEEHHFYSCREARIQMLNSNSLATAEGLDSIPVFTPPSLIPMLPTTCACNSHMMLTQNITFE